jgi:hypothetical protein
VFRKNLISQTTLEAGSGKRFNKLICCAKRWVMVALSRLRKIVINIGSVIKSSKNNGVLLNIYTNSVVAQAYPIGVFVAFKFF